MKATRPAHAAASEVEVATCAWRTGAAGCGLHVFSQHRCQWHQHWVRMVDAGAISRSQCEEFAEWWEQFQPYGTYADNPGPWWATLDALWPALTGCGDAPVLTAGLAAELHLRRAEVQRFRAGIPWKDPWPRLHDPLLPRWDAEHWQAKVHARQIGCPTGRERDAV